MKIKEYTTLDLELKCVNLLASTYLQLGQKSDAKSMNFLGSILCEDLQTDFQDLTMDDIIHAFKQGIRNTDDFHLTVKTYYKWIKAHQQIIWNNEKVDPIMQDKRLKYRSRNGTGMKKISINKTLIS